MIQPTLARKLFFRIAPTILITIAVIGALAFRSATREINNIYDAQLINDANVLWTLLEHEVEKPGPRKSKQVNDIDLEMGNQLAMNEDADDYAEAHMFRAWKDGQISVFSSTAFPQTVPVQRAGFTNIQYDGEDWRVYALPIPRTTIVMEVGEKLELRKTLVSNILLNLSFPLVILFPLLALLIWFGIQSGLSAIHGLVSQIRSRSPDDLSSIPIGALPRDLFPLGRSINQLLNKLDRSLTAERRFADHAAHQLRTPQAGVRLLIQMLATAETEEERRAILCDLMVSNDKAMHLIEQLLRAARVSYQPVEMKNVPLYQTVAAVIAELGNIINLKKLDVSLRGDTDAQVNADEPLLRLMVNNLIDNAIKYTPAGGTIEVTIEAEAENWRLSIADSGPGIATQHRDAVFQRFYRVDTPQVEGSGLGLAIVSDIISRLSASIALNVPDSGRGLRVDVVMPKV
ncbi:histidine kinase [Pararhizobium polonicum]|uniref:histidine kinase n=1 Tax=Pararhizobium polonicum TaxID=1612624 RepID=A0A1C7P123_9HYPH|nr:ATP-binding protein [Pararhizobium polonicum]OBZ94920.1 histidine kinase [Pararhizobium polonicum]